MIYRSTLVLFLFSVHIVSFANDSGFYIGGSLGYSSLGEEESALFSDGVPGVFPTFNFAAPPDLEIVQFLNIPRSSDPNLDIDDEDLGWKVYGGYHFNKYFGIEIGYTDLGKIKADHNLRVAIGSPALAFTSDVNRRTAANVSGFQFAGLVRYPLTKEIEVFGKLGGYVRNVDFTTNATSQASLTFTSPPVIPVTVPTLQPFSSSREDEGISLMFGVGGEYKFNERIAIRAEWERYNNIFNNILGDQKNKVDLFSIGIKYKFDI